MQMASPLAGATAQRAVEDKLIAFAVWLVEVRGVKAQTAKAYVSTVRAWHARRFGEMLPAYTCVRLRAVLKGMKAVQRLEPRVPRRGVRTQHLAAAIRRCLDRSADGTTLKAACELAFCGLLRVSEYCVSSEGNYDVRELPVIGDVRFGRDDQGEYASVLVRPRKKGARCKGKSVPVFVRDGTLLQPVQSLRRMLAQRRAAPNAPLFVLGGEPLRASEMHGVVKWLMASVGQNPDEFGSHSLRIGGATAALAAGVPPESIRIMGRWDSDVYEIYCRLTRQASLRLGTVVASTAFEDVEGEFCHEELV